MARLSGDETSAWLFEIGWEVCAQIGGIYTVLRSKAPAMLEEWGDRYHLVGPCDSRSSEAEFEPLQPEGMLGRVIAALREDGVQCRYGRWLISGYPRVVLLDYSAAYSMLTDLRYRYWLDHNISIPPDDALSDRVLLFSELVVRFLGAVAAHLPESDSVVAHFHEWMTGLAIAAIRKRGIPAATVFTTHATTIGRAYCADRDDFYDVLDRLNPDYESGRRGMYHRYCIERAAAATADVFTTVSDVTASEARALLGREPDLITPNGLRVQKFEALHEFQNLHRQYKEQLHEFVMGHFFGSYSFDLERTLYVFLAGRYEYRNKGMDVYLEALARLNRRLAALRSETTVVAFLITKAATHGLNGEVLSSRFVFEELRRFCDRIREEMGRRLYLCAATGRLPGPDDLARPDEIVQLKRIMQSCRRGHLPIVTTHNLQDDAFDPVICDIRRLALFNAPEDRVKIVYHPDFITPSNPLFRMDYDPCGTRGSTA